MVVVNWIGCVDGVVDGIWRNCDVVYGGIFVWVNDLYLVEICGNVWNYVGILYIVVLDNGVGGGFVVVFDVVGIVWYFVIGIGLVWLDYGCVMCNNCCVDVEVINVEIFVWKCVIVVERYIWVGCIDKVVVEIYFEWIDVKIVFGNIDELVEVYCFVVGIDGNGVG